MPKQDAGSFDFVAPAFASSSVQRKPPQGRWPAWVVVPAALLLACAVNAKPAAGYAAFAGSESCRGCHPVEYQRWSQSAHGVAERPLRLEADRRAFEPARNFRHGTDTTTVRAKDGQFQIVTLGSEGNLQPFQVERLIGSSPLVQFLTPFLCTQAQVQDRLGQLPDALKTLDQAEAAVPDEPHIPYVQATIWALDGQHDKARVSANRARAIQRNF